MLKTVVIVSNVCTPGGGASQVAHDSALGLVAQGINVVFFCAQGAEAGDLEEAGVMVKCLGVSPYSERTHRVKAAFDGIYDKTVFTAFERVLANFDPSSTIVHFHSWQHALSCSPIDCASRMGFPVVITAHEYSSVCPNMALFNFQRIGKCDREPMSTSCLLCNCDKRGYMQKLYRFVREVVLRRSLRRAKPTVIFISKFSRSVLEGKRALGGVVGTSVNLPDPVTNNIAVTSSIVLPESGYFAFIGRLSPEKAPGLFCEAVRTAGVRGIVVGDGELRSELEHEYPEIVFTGWLDKGDVAAVRANARGVVFPSHCYETAGLSALEAMIFDAVPCIASDGCATREFIEDGVTGLLFRDGDVGSLSDCLCKLADDDFFERLRANIFTKDFSEFTLASHINGLKRVYECVLGEVVS